VFYESIGAQLGRAAEALTADDPARPVDERGQRERRQIISLLRRIAVIWPELFRSLEEESTILAATRNSAAEVVRAHGLDSAGEPASAPLADPLARYRQLHCELDALVILLHEQGPEAWAQDALRSLRRGLADAAEVQGRLVDDMLAARR
jgi:hypothetical protein